MILATQSVVELMASEMLHVVNESCPTKIFLANPNIDRKLYAEIFQLNDTQLELLESLVPKRELLLIQPRGTKKLVLEVDALGYWMVTNNARDNLRKQDYFARLGPERGLIQLAQDYPNPFNAYSLRNDHQKTYELASALKTEHPESWKATMLLIHSAPNSEKFDDLLARATVQDLLRQEVLRALAYRALRTRLYGIGRKYATDAIDATDTPWPFTKLTLAQCISHNVLLGRDAKPAEGFSEDDKKLLEKADDIFKEAVTGAKERDEGYIAAQALIERAGIAERLGDEKSARPLVEEAYRLAPDDPNAQGAYATLLQRMGDTDRAIAIVEHTLREPIGGGGFKRQLAELLLSRSRGDDEQRAANLLKEISLANDPIAI